MTPNKRRKLDAVAPKNVSAFAARKQLRDAKLNVASAAVAGTETTIDGRSRSNSEYLPRSLSSDDLNEASQVVGTRPSEYGGHDESQIGNISDMAEKEADSAESNSMKSPGTTPSILVQSLTTIEASKKNIERLQDGSLSVKIGPGEKLIALGEYELSVAKGQISIAGAILSASKEKRVVYAPSSHALPVIRAFDSGGKKAHIRLQSVDHGIRSLRRISPLFAGLWNDTSESTTKGEVLDGQHPLSHILETDVDDSFQIIFSASDYPNRSLYPIVSPPQWNQAIAETCDSIDTESGRVCTTIICGPKGSGKSTLARLLTNSVLTKCSYHREIGSRAKHGERGGVLFLDLDPGQPEYSVPGSLSLNRVYKPNLGPPYTHSDGSQAKTTTLRAHSIAAVSQAVDPEYYMECVKDLLSHCADIRSSSRYPLVINTPGWILGTGLELLLDVIREARPSRVLYTSQEGPQDVVESLRDAAKAAPVLTLPSQPFESGTRTSAQLRIMQYLSYFHRQVEGAKHHLWNSKPLTALAPWEVKYDGKGAGILGILCLGEQSLPSMLRDAIDGMLLAVTVVDDLMAVRTRNGTPGMATERTGGSDAEPGEERLDSLNDESPENAFIIRTPEHLPYFDPASQVTLDPTFSRTIGLVLVRGLDSKRRRLQLLTSIPDGLFDAIRSAGKSIVLVLGRLDTPGWAYTEDFYEQIAARKNMEQDIIPKDRDAGKQGTRGSDTPTLVPWTEAIHGDEGRGIESRVWRVRRDLGKSVGRA